ncbi:hypothetical protein [Treponema endosymbiont of Eucomonympha sp.]|uniref:hypothetical protein n=1 Tax=Treponema endosymbiont of Eucomonympha sp. TaxID=1580831 RepID=UPI0007829EF0|nr:hypothetical protein [Treponema endosymbiont of Eucomonympha sp.]
MSVAKRQNPLPKLPSLNKSCFDEKMLISLSHFDRNQGQSFVEWEKEEILADFLEKLRDFTELTRSEAGQTKMLVVYGDFPTNSKFKEPSHTPRDAEWCRIKISGKVRIAGHIIANVFYIVFLDKNHEFFISEKKHT